MLSASWLEAPHSDQGMDEIASSPAATVDDRCEGDPTLGAPLQPVTAVNSVSGAEPLLMIMNGAKENSSSWDRPGYPQVGEVSHSGFRGR